MTLTAFYRELQNHDWFHEMCDSHKETLRGRKNEQRLRCLAYEYGPDYVQLFNSYKSYIHEVGINSDQISPSKAG